MSRTLFGSCSQSNLFFPQSAASNKGSKSQPTPFALSFLPPTKPSSHPLILLNPDAAHQAIPMGILSSDESHLSPPAHDVQVPIVKIEPFVHMRNVGGVFLRPADADDLSLAPMGEADTVYGPVQRYSSVQAIIFGRETSIENVFELPAAFNNTQYSEGIIGIDTLRSLGLSVAVDRGMVYLQDPELSEYSDHKF
ncbi:hypothetical protein PhCBS80983_g05051 [Powellomyces hirtus]|uniref:Uncharacterized protein n=1 Tax=Powellomyces hirtus TaxID=109895 RepID=A0A507DVN7_9FUNG|nr:hypothetical protein DFJ77DRAFT_457476 [Powellomyces hirtus]TPX55783.1 hypothetical protein PhCBS80983_g05051 [Powellomyces hirtus]